MTIRQILQFPGTPSVQGYPSLDVTQAEIAVANIDGLVYWPGMEAWDIPASKDKFLDRLTDAECPVFAVGTDVSTSFSKAVGEKIMYKVASVNYAPIDPDFKSSGSFTVAAVVRDQVGFGSYGDPTQGNGGSWYVNSETSTASADKGKIRFSLADVTITYGQYNGPLLDDTKLAYLVLIVDRATNSATLRVNGATAIYVVNPNISNRALLNGLRIGTAVSSTNGTVPRYGYYGSVVAFERALAGSDLAALEAMLAEAATK